MLILCGSLVILGLIVNIVLKKLPRERQVKLVRHICNDRVMTDIRKTDPKCNAFEGSIDFYLRKLSMSALIISAGSLLAFGYELRSLSSHDLIEGNAIERRDHGGGSRNVRLKVGEAEGPADETVNVTVSELRYTSAELEQLAEEAKEQLLHDILGDNASFDRIADDMVLPSSLSGYPFRISWRTDDPLLINSKGVINRARYEDKDLEDKDMKTAAEGILTGIHGELTYEDHTSCIDMAVRVFPIRPKELTLGEYVGELIRKADKATREEPVLKLPEYVEGREIRYEEAGDPYGVLILVLVAVTAVLMYRREDSRLNDKVRKRDAELKSDYPVLVNKFALFYCAGLTTRGIWHKLCGDYRDSLEHGGRRRYLYEEMLLCEGRMNEGMGELASYETFASACGLNIYRHFVSLISQAVGRGRSDMILMLEDEAGEAFSERKRRARELGEEAGTKLLLPMFIMLIVVLIIVTVPAFISFR